MQCATVATHARCAMLPPEAHLTSDCGELLDSLRATLLVAIASYPATDPKQLLWGLIEPKQGLIEPKQAEGLIEPKHKHNPICGKSNAQMEPTYNINNRLRHMGRRLPTYPRRPYWRQHKTKSYVWEIERLEKTKIH